MIIERSDACVSATLARMLARAFADDPLARYVFPRDDSRGRGLVRVYELYLRFFLRRGRVYTTRERSAAALWLPPGRYPLTLGEHVRLLPRMIHATGVTGFPAATRVLDHLDGMHPAGEVFWYLGVLGVEPEQQRKGLGSELMMEGLHACDVGGTAAYLETAEPSNLRFYSRFGFSVLCSSTLRDGPQVWGLWRQRKVDQSG